MRVKGLPVRGKKRGVARAAENRTQFARRGGNTVPRGYDFDVTIATTWGVLRLGFALCSIQWLWSTALTPWAARIGCSYPLDLIVGLPDWEQFEGRTLRPMTPEEFDTQFKELNRTNDLERVAARTTLLVDPKDVAQDIRAALSAMRPEQYAHIRSLKLYAFRMVRNRGIELAVEKKREPPRVELDDEGRREQKLQTLEQSSYLKDPSELVEQEQYHKLVREAMKDLLTPLERSTAWRVHVKGESGPSIARRSGLSIDKVRGLREGGMKKLRRFFEIFCGTTRRDHDK
jgi:DNA-directed RNA polymerase specialized sigma24 family protein